MTEMPVGMPFFSMVAISASATLPCLHSAMNAASAGLPCAARVASGCSAATAQKVTPMMVSARVVNTHNRPFSPPPLAGEGPGERVAPAAPSPDSPPQAGERDEVPPSAGKLYGKAKRTPVLLPI